MYKSFYLNDNVRGYNIFSGKIYFILFLIIFFPTISYRTQQILFLDFISKENIINNFFSQMILKNNIFL